MAIELAPTNALHHCQVLQIVVRLKQSIACKELDKNASNTPDITGKGPTQTKNNFWSAVMASGDNR